MLTVDIPVTPLALRPKNVRQKGIALNLFSKTTSRGLTASLSQIKLARALHKQ
jgi:hypothetical protein